MDHIFVYFLILTVLLGLVFGSFLNCMAYRMVRGEDFIRGRSKCTSCGHELSAIDLIPVFGYIINQGKCRYCRAAISIRYPLTELVFAGLLVGIYLKNGISFLTLRDMILTGILFTLSIVDIESFTIPDGFLIAGFIDWIAFAYSVSENPSDILVNLATGLLAGLFILIISLVMDKALKKESMGGGDIKLIALLGLFTGPLGICFLIFIACVVGLVLALVLKIGHRLGEGGAFPFGPAIAVSAYIMLIFGSSITDWYIGFFG
ncbi:MAG: prepilin peptidase [Lachnospiraceae bacterium]|nr:prepilin peptidase [Lachnospiraceae bacterium]